MKKERYYLKIYFSDYCTKELKLTKQQFNDQVKQLNKEMAYSKENTDNSMWIEFDCRTIEENTFICEEYFYKNGYVEFRLQKFKCKDGYCFK